MTKKRKTPSRATRFRLRFTFWLDLNKPDENLIAEMVADLKASKLFAKTIRDGIRLICDLRAGRLGVLFELFPWVREEMEQGRVQQPITAIEAQLARLEKLMEQNGGVVVDANPQILTPTSGSKPLVAPTFAMPQFDDNEDTLNFTQGSDIGYITNFLNQIKSL